MYNDAISDLITRIRNGQRAGQRSVKVPEVKLFKVILALLKKEGFIAGFESVESQTAKAKNDRKLSSDSAKKPRELPYRKRKAGKVLNVILKYDQNGEPVISELKRISKPGLRQYLGNDRLKPVRGGLGSVIVSTSRGIITDREARKLKVGGEPLFLIA